MTPEQKEQLIKEAEDRHLIQKMAIDDERDCKLEMISKGINPSNYDFVSYPGMTGRVFGYLGGLSQNQADELKSAGLSFSYTVIFKQETTEIKVYPILDYTKIEDIEFSGIDHKDAPDYCDAYISSALYDGREMSEDELEVLNEDHDFVYDKLQSNLH